MGDVIQEVAAETVRALPDLALGTRTGRPKAWGALAGHGVTALRARLGRQLTDAERRALWTALWREALRVP
ncbi:MAG TPA: hypothetical protein VKE23_08725 [Candidatus Limnocylindria bacterium]|nr:hypothetical protein [Candidatus Limnocylindria bacterium]